MEKKNSADKEIEFLMALRYTIWILKVNGPVICFKHLRWPCHSSTCPPKAVDVTIKFLLLTSSDLFLVVSELLVVLVTNVMYLFHQPSGADILSFEAGFFFIHTSTNLNKEDYVALSNWPFIFTCYFVFGYWPRKKILFAIFSIICFV